jgi:hypothetical protein
MSISHERWKEMYLKAQQNKQQTAYQKGKKKKVKK